MNGIERRLGQLEHYFVGDGPDLVALRAYDAAWSAAVDAIALTMSPEHLQLVLDVGEAGADGPGRRLLNAFRSRIVGRIGPGPEFPDASPQWPDSPLALPPVVAELYMQEGDLSAGLHVVHGKVCATCCYMVPVLQRREPVECDQDGVWRWLDGEQASSSGVPFVAIERKAFRHLSPIDPCPLCGGPILKPANWYPGLEFLNVVTSRKREAS